MPTPVARAAGRLAYRYPLARRVVARLRPSGLLAIQHGPAAGMRIWSDGSMNLGYVMGTTEPVVQQALADHLRPGDVCFDIGANVGFFSLVASRAVGQAGRVYAFEPLPENASALRRNLEANHLANVTLVEAAVSDHDGVGQLSLGQSGLDPRLAEHRPSDYRAQEITVTVIALDDTELPAPSLVKIDVEGAEFAVLAGMQRTLVEHRPIVLCEMHDYRDTHVEDVRSALGESAAGYDVRLLEPEADETYWAPHVLAIPRRETNPRT